MVSMKIYFHSILSFHNQRTFDRGIFSSLLTKNRTFYDNDYCYKFANIKSNHVPKSAPKKKVSALKKIEIINVGAVSLCVCVCSAGYFFSFRCKTVQIVTMWPKVKMKRQKTDCFSFKAFFVNLYLSLSNLDNLWFLMMLSLSFTIRLF